MLTGFLNTALEIIIILDICGAIVYFVLAGLKKDKKEETQPGYSPLSIPALQPAIASAPTPGPRAASADHDVFSVYAGPPSEPQKHTSLMAGVKHSFTSLKEKLTACRPFAGQQSVSPPKVGPDHRNLDQILDSFREET